MKKYLFAILHVLLIALILLNPWTSWGAVYYVNQSGGDDAKNGLSTDNAWKTISKVNASSFSAGDSILFAKDNTWREQLTVPSSGSAGNPITFGAYGSGAAPIINGADLVTTWTQYTSSGETNVFTDGFEDNTTNAWTSDGANSLVDAESKRSGTYGLHHDGAASDAWVEKTITQNAAVGIRFYMYLNAESLADTQKTKLYEFRTAGSTVTKLWIIQTSGVLYLDLILGAGSSVASTYAVTTGQWYKIEVEYGISATTGFFRFYVNDNVAENNINQNTGTDLINRARLGPESWQASAIDVYLDDVEVYTIGAGGATNIYSASVDWDANMVLEDGDKLDEVTWNTNIATTSASMGAGKWTLDTTGNLLYVNATDNTDPDTHTMEVATRDKAFYLWHKPYITVNGLTLTGSNAQGIQNLGSPNFTADNVTATLNAGQGVYLVGQDADNTIDNFLIRDSSLSYNGGEGISTISYGHDGTITGNTAHHNCWNIDGTYGTDAGIKIWGPIGAAELGDITITSNTTYLNGPTPAVNTRGAGIWLDNTAGGNFVAYNHIYNNGFAGIYLEKQLEANTIAYNLIHDEAATTQMYAGSGIWAADQPHGQLIYNNTIYNCKVGISVYSNWPEQTNGCQNNIVKNNIVNGSTTRALSAWAGGENDGTYGSGNVYEYNALGPEAANFIEWGGGNFLSTYSGFATAYGGSTHSVTTDPLFVSAGSDFRLQSTSPAINAGVDVGLTTDYLGNPIVGLPDVGAYEDQASGSTGGPLGMMSYSQIVTCYGGTGTRYDRAKAFYNTAGCYGTMADMEYCYTATLGCTSGTLIDRWSCVYGVKSYELGDAIRAQCGR